MAGVNIVRRFASVVIICTSSLLFMLYAGPSPTLSALDWLVPWGFLAMLLFGFVWATVRFKIPRATAADTLSKARGELEERALDGDRQPADTAPSVAQANGPESTESEDSNQQENRENGKPRRRLEAEHLSRRPRAFIAGKPFYGLWKRFRAAWLAHDRNRSGQGVGIASAADVFTTESVLRRTGETIPDALPGVFTAVGLLGTFVGIAIGLAGIPDGASGGAPSADDLSQSINTLMGGMSTAFSTSIIGITGSIWWLFEFRRARRQLAWRLARFVDVADRLFPFEQPHDTLRRIAIRNSDTVTVLREVKGGIQTLGEDMASALEPLIEQRITKPIQDLNLSLGERQTEALGRMVSEFRDTLVSHVGEELHRFGEALKTARAHQSSTVAELESFFLLLESVTETQLKVLDRGGSVAATFERGLSALTEAQQAIEQAGSAAGRIMKQAEDLVGESKQQVNAQREATEAVLATWTQEKDELRDSREHLLALTSELGEKIVEFRSLAAEKIGEVFHAFDSEMGKVVDHLGGTLAELRDTTEEFPSIAIRLVDITSDLAETSRTQHESFTRGLKAFEEGVGEIAGKLDTGRLELARASEALPARTQEITDGIGGLAAAIKDARADLEENANGTIRATGKASERLRSAVSTMEAVGESVDSLKSAVSELSQQLSGQVGRAARTGSTTSARRPGGEGRRPSLLAASGQVVTPRLMEHAPVAKHRRTVERIRTMATAARTEGCVDSWLGFGPSADEEVADVEVPVRTQDTAGIS